MFVETKIIKTIKIIGHKQPLIQDYSNKLNITSLNLILNLNYIINDAPMLTQPLTIIKKSYLKKEYQKDLIIKFLIQQAAKYFQ